MAGAGIDWVPAPSAVLAPASHHRVTGAVLGMAIAIAVHHIAVHHTVAAPSFGRPRSLIILHGRTLALYRARQSRRNSRPGSTKRPGRPYPMSRWTRRPLARIRSAKGGSVGRTSWRPHVMRWRRPGARPLGRHPGPKSRPRPSTQPASPTRWSLPSTAAPPNGCTARSWPHAT